MTDEVRKLMEEKAALVWQLNILQEKLSINQYDRNIQYKMMAVKEKINRIKRKISVFKMRDLRRED